MGKTPAWSGWPGLIFTLTLFCTTACAGNSARTEPSSEAPAGLPDLHQTTPAAGPEPELPTVSWPQMLPPLPQGRSSSGLTENIIDGADTWQRSSAAQVLGSELLLDPGASAQADDPPYTLFAIYRFNSANALDSVNISQTASGDGAYIGLSNYARGVWEFSGPYTGGKTIPLDSGGSANSPYVSLHGDLYIAVIPAPASQATIRGLSVRVINPGNQPPVAQVNQQGATGDAPLSLYFNAGASTDADGYIVEYAWDWDGNGGYEEFSDQPVIAHVFTLPGLYPVRLRVTDDQLGRDTIVREIAVNAVGNYPPLAELLPATSSGNTPLTVNFDASGSDAGGDLDDSIVLYEWDFDGDGLYDSYGPVATASHVYEFAGNYEPGVRVSDEAGNQASSSGQVVVNQSPSAVLRILPNDVQKGEDVEMDASLSSDQDGSIAKYEWDTDADGIFETDSGLESLITVTTSRAGSLPIVLRVTDDAGSTTVTSELLHVHGGLGNRVRLEGADQGILPEICVVQGKPAIVYTDSSLDSLCYMRALDAGGQSWGSPQVISGSAVVNTAYVSLVIIDGNPATCYHDQTTGDICFQRALDPQGDSWGTAVTAVNNGNTGQYSHSNTSVCDVGGFPAIAFTAHTPLNMLVELRYLRALDPDGVTWGSSVLLDTHENNEVSPQCERPQLLMVNGQPAVVYTMLNWWSHLMRYVRAIDPAGTSWASPVLPLNQEEVGLWASFALVNNKPAIGYCSWSGLEFCRATDSDGASWGIRQAIDGNASGYNTDLAVVAGLPTIAYCGLNGHLYSMSALDGDGAAWGSGELVDALKVDYPAMCELASGHPGIVYNDSALDGGMYFLGWFE